MVICVALLKTLNLKCLEYTSEDKWLLQAMHWEGKREYANNEWHVQRCGGYQMSETDTHKDTENLSMT